MSLAFADVDDFDAAMSSSVIAATVDTERWPFGDVRDEVMNLWGIVKLAGHFRHFGGSAPWDLESLAALLRYALEDETPKSRKKRTPMDVDALVVKWVPIIRGLSSAHTKDEIDRCEFESETHLSPLLTAPVKQLREFFAKLVTALESDPTIPFFVHRTFAAYHEGIVKRAPDADIKTLKTALATEIAEMVEKDVVPDIREAIIGALQWRSTSQLEDVKEAVSSGAKPRLRGKESCLFLVVSKPDGTEATVML